MYKHFKQLSDIIHEVSEPNPIIYVPNVGNWGDALIRESTLKFFKDHSIKYLEIPFFNRFWTNIINTPLIEKFIKNSVLVYGGGGAWYKTFNSGAQFISHIHQYFRNVIVLPSTLMIPLKTDNVIYYCRDRFESKLYYPNATFCHDMAFYLNDIFFKEEGKGDGYFFRKDEESSQQLFIPESNIDISSFGNEVTPISPFISKINEYETIHTDRLHVAIIACLLNKQLYFYNGSYYKNEATYHSSIENYFKKVEFIKR